MMQKNLSLRMKRTISGRLADDQKEMDRENLFLKIGCEERKAQPHKYLYLQEIIRPGTRISRIGRIYTDPCSSASSVQSVFYRNPVIIYDDKKPQMNADKRRFVAINHRKVREERKAQKQISSRSGMKIINNELVRTPYELMLPEFVSVCFSSLFFPDRIYRIDRMVE